mgnify:CR=1 FL=1
MLAARRAYERAIDLAGGSPYWLSGVARAALATGDIEGAEAALRRALDEAGDADQVGAALTAAGRQPIDALPIRQSEIMVLALVQRVPEARALLDALQAQVPGDPVSAALGDWLDGIAGE